MKICSVLFCSVAGDVKLTAYGRSITERYGSNMDISRNGIEKKIIRYIYIREAIL